jgi:hypothetical protein
MKRFFFFITIVSVWFAVADVKAQRPPDPRTIVDATRWRLATLQKAVEPLYRKPTKTELEAVEPRAEIFEKYADFLRREPNSGLTKLIDDKGCAENTKIVVATDNCLKYSMPGAGSAFSFRTESYRIRRLADLIFTDQSFQASGVLLHGIFVNVGDVPLQQITLQIKELKYLREFQPEPNYAKAKEIDRRLTEGIRQNGFLYRRGLYAVENTTFVLRSIAYSGKYYRAVAGVTYNEFDFDKRKDVIVAFRIVEKDAAGNVTILWKKLQEKDSPSVKRSNEKRVN